MKNNYRIIDAHAHIFPSNISEKAVKSIGNFYGINMEANGTSEDLISRGSEIGVEKYVVHSTATTVHQVSSINNYIYGEMQKHKEFIGFMTLHPDMPISDIEKEVELALSRGISGVKLHPDFQRFNVDEADNIYQSVRGRLPILFHIGDNRYDFSSPKRLMKLAEKYPDLICIAAHFGGYSKWDSAKDYIGFQNIYFDTSSSLPFISNEYAGELIHLLGVERFFFGVDYPMWSHVAEYERFMNIQLTEEERQKIFYDNIAKLLSL